MNRRFNPVILVIAVLAALLLLFAVTGDVLAKGNNGKGNPPAHANNNKPRPNKPVKPNANKPAKPNPNKPVNPGNGSKPDKPNGGNPDKPKPQKVTICHATGSATNPYVRITISVNGLHGHGKHENDVIPAPTTCPAVVIPGANIPPVLTVSVDKPSEAPAPESPDVDKPDSVPGPDKPDSTPDRDEPMFDGPVGEFLHEPVGSLPYTGAELIWILLLGAGLVAGGTYLYRNR